MRIAYLDVLAGISGDMTLGALVDAGVSLDAIREELEKIPMHGWQIEAVPCSKSGIAGTQVKVSLHEHHHQHEGHEGHDHHHHHHGRSCKELVDLIEGSSLDPEVVEQSTAILWRVADAEAKIHSTTRDAVHFHELGGLDSIVDIVGAVVGFRLLGVDEIVCSPLPISHGFVDCAHGRLPVPAPATTELMKGFPTFPVDVDGETVTPTGAALATSLANRFGEAPAMTIEAIGYGCGQKDWPGMPNVLRLLVGERSGAMPGIEGGEGTWGALIGDRINVIEANLDDMSPELFPRVVERAFEAGAADVWMTPIYMKKGRPGTQLSVAASPEATEAVAAVVLEESTSFGVRISNWERRCLPREKVEVETPYGPIGIKIGKIGDRQVTCSAEYEDCARAAREHGVPLKEVYAAAMDAARKK